MIRLAMADGVGRHVRQDEVGRPAEHRLERLGRLVRHEIHLDEIDAGDGIDRKEIDGDDATLAGRRGGALGGELRPSARSGAEIQNAQALLQEMGLVVDLEELVDRSRSIAFSRWRGRHRGH